MHISIQLSLLESILAVLSPLTVIAAWVWSLWNIQKYWKNGVLTAVLGLSPFLMLPGRMWFLAISSLVTAVAGFIATAKLNWKSAVTLGVVHAFNIFVIVYLFLGVFNPLMPMMYRWWF